MMLNDFFTAVANRGRSIVGLANIDRSKASSAGVIGLCHRLLSSRGEASGLALSREVLSCYQMFDTINKRYFFEALQVEFGVDEDASIKAAEAYLADSNQKSLNQLNQILQSPRRELLSRLNQTPEATHHLVEMRADLIAFMDQGADFKDVDQDFAQVLTTWFNRGFLELKQVDWNTPAAILEKIIKYEAVHGIENWEALRQRIEPEDRLIYAFFHPRLVDEPLIFVEVALVKSTPDSIESILDGNREPINSDKADTATFYSISNCQTGLRGIPLGNFLIKQVVEDLRRQFPNLKDFVTLSPIPSLTRWTSKNINTSDNVFPEEFLSAWNTLVGSDDDGQEESVARAETEIMPYIAWYLTQAKTHFDRPVDPVARFHLGNGARLERINWMADVSNNGMRQSCGAMVNYRYILDDIESNHESFANDGTIATTNALRKMSDNFQTKIDNLNVAENQKLTGGNV